MSVTTIFFLITVASYVLVGVIFYIAYLMALQHRDGYGWLIFMGIMLGLLGGYSLKNEDTATCPKCGTVFEVKIDDKKGSKFELTQQ